jgi:hypothetical protein
MRVLVTEARQASPDGIAILSYEAGQAYDMPEALAAVFAAEGWGQVEGEGRAPGPVEIKPDPGPARKKRGE